MYCNKSQKNVNYQFNGLFKSHNVNLNNSNLIKKWNGRIIWFMFLFENQLSYEEP